MLEDAIKYGNLEDMLREVGITMEEFYELTQEEEK